MHTASLGRRDRLISAQVTHQARAFRRGLDVVTSAEISPSRRTQHAVCIFSYESIEGGKIELSSKVNYFGENARWADLTIRLVVKANSMSARMCCLYHTCLMHGLPSEE